MSNPVIADNNPIAVSLEKDREYYFCTCGRSSNQPFCDGSHAGTSFNPMPFTAKADKEAYLCQCKYSKSLPFCDGTHNKFPDDQIGKEGSGV